MHYNLVAWLYYHGTGDVHRPGGGRPTCCTHTHQCRHTELHTTIHLGESCPACCHGSRLPKHLGTSGFNDSLATVNVPAWWYAVMAISSGFNHAVVEGLPSSSDMRTYEQQAHLATIADPRLRQESNDFFSECFIPA